MELQDYLARHDYTLLRRLNRKSSAQTLLLGLTDGTRLVCRVYDHEVPSYETALDIHIPELPTVYAYTREGGSVIVEEEYVDGILLSEVLECMLPDTRQTAAIAVRICAALAALHEKGVIHRDVKPEHVILTAAGRVALVDLDAASDYDPGKARDTQLLGTVGYAAPEQFGFARSDARTDIFSLGVMMNVMLTGRHPSGGLAEGELQGIIETCVAMDAARRYRTVEELAARLRPLAGKDARCPKCGFVSPGGGCLCCGDPSPEPKPKRTRRGLLAAAALFCVMLAFLAGRALLPAPESEEDGQEPVSGVVDTERGGRELTGKDCIVTVPDRLAFFTYDGSVYYMGPRFSNVNYPWDNTVNSALSEGDYEDKSFDIVFWTRPEGSTEEEYRLVTDRTLIDELTALFDEDSLKLSVYARQAEGVTTPERFPVISDGEDTGYPCPILLRLGLEHRGDWVVVASGRIGGETLTAATTMSWQPFERVSFTPEAGTEDAVAAINAFLASYDARDSITLQITLPAGEHEGYIVVPEWSARMNVEISGAYDELDPSAWQTTLRGGICCNSKETAVYANYIAFVGSGKGEPYSGFSGNGSEAECARNYGIYGGGFGRAYDCSFTGYDIALYSRDCTDCVFEDNRVALCIDIPVAESNGEVYNSIFLHNAVGIQFADIGGRAVSSFFIDGNEFIDNERNLVNNTGKELPTLRWQVLES